MGNGQSERASAMMKQKFVSRRRGNRAHTAGDGACGGHGRKMMCVAGLFASSEYLLCRSEKSK